MATQSSLGRHWWSQQFIQALESFTEPNRLKRGRSYSSDYRLKTFDINGSLVLATVRGNVNSYFGVTREHTYITTLEFQPISPELWAQAIALISSRAGLISKLMMNEIPDNIEDSFRPLNLTLLPQGINDCQTNCTCPDYSNPCKHIAGLYYRVAQALDQDPFLLFELRGLSRAALQKELAKSPLGAALSGELNQATVPAAPVTSLYSRPQGTAAPLEISVQEFWQGASGQASRFAAPERGRDKASVVAAIAIKKQADYPSFWQRHNSFIQAMEAFYQRVRRRNQGFLE